MSDPETLTPERLLRFRTLLVEERDAAERRIRRREADISGDARPRDEVVDRADAGQAEEARERLMDENDADRGLLERIDHALERIERGTYGTSEVSGRPIGLDRLEAVPWATTIPGEPDPRED